MCWVLEDRIVLWGLEKYDFDAFVFIGEMVMIRNVFLDMIRPNPANYMNKNKKRVYDTVLSI